MKRKTNNSILIDCIFRNRPSGRREHLRANKDIFYLCRFLAIASAVVAIAFWLGDEKTKELALFYRDHCFPYVFLVPHFVRIHEVWASPDRDIRTRGSALAWKIYAARTRHRGIFSHTLLIGTPTRFVIAYWPAVLILGYIIYLLSKNEYSLFRAINTSWLAKELVMLFPWWYTSALISDVTHFVVDRMNLIEMLLTGDP